MSSQASDKKSVGGESSSGKDVGKTCGECKEEVVKNGVECEVCETRFHPKCAGLAAGTHKALELDKSLHWYCLGCSRGVVNTWKKLQERQEMIEKEVAGLKVEVKGIKDMFGKLGKMETVMESNKKELRDLGMRIKKVEETDKEMESKKEKFLVKEVEDMKQSFKGIVKEQELEREKELKTKDRDMHQKMIEMLEREKRRNNLIIRGIKETKDCDEKEEVDKILEALVEEVNIKYEIVGRVGRLESDRGDIRSRPLRIRIEEVEHKRRLLARGKNLKEAKDDMLRRVYVAPDLTRMQQEEDKKLRDKVKELREDEMKNDKERTNIKIVRGEIVRVVDGVREVLFSLEK
jgi:hypothetical protein